MLYVDEDQSCVSLSSSSSIDYWLIYNVCESNTSAGRPDHGVPFAVMQDL